MKRHISPFCLIVILILFSNLTTAKQTYLNESDAWEQNITKIYYSSIVSGDIDSDGDLDLVTIGNCGISCYSAKVYTNNGTSFSYNLSLSQNLTNMHYGSVALGDIDNDGDLDLVLTGCSSGGSYTGLCNAGAEEARIYLNNGTSFVENTTWQQNLTGVWRSSVALGDIDNDGDLDLVLSGDTGVAWITKIYLNNGTSFVENTTWQQNLTGVRQSAVSFGDIDNDGDLDLVLSGRKTGPIKFTMVYLNNGTSFVENIIWTQSLTSVDDSSIALADFDNDGDLDLSLYGCCDEHRIYKNNGSTFIQTQKELEDLDGMFAGSQSFGDYDNDGDVDLITSGREESTVLYLFNVTNTNFTGYWQDPESDMLNLYYSTVLWVDMDNDTDLDLVSTGYGSNDLQRFVYTSNRSLTLNNTLPKSPNSTDFSASYANNQLTLRWGNGSDNETNMTGLYYNLRVGTTSGGNQIVSGVYGGSSNPTAGYFGNMMQRKSITLGGSWLRNSTTYYWSVQTIDTGLAKSNWSLEQTFTTAADITYPSIEVNYPADANYTSFSNITFSANISDNVAVSNVSLYGTWGGWHRNQTNSSGINGTAYIFQANLSAYGEGSFTWAIRACDTTNNCIFSANRTVVRDLSAPLVYLESPANSSSWTDNNSITFSFNVTDFAIQNCSLVINGYSLKYNFTSVTVNTSTSATITLSNGNYNWSVNCTDNLLRQNKSETRTLTVNYQAPAAPSSSGGGGGGGGLAYSTYSLGELKESQEVNKELGKGDKIKFSLKGEEHNLTIKRVTSENATIELNSSSYVFILAVNESRKLNLSNAEFYDLVIKLNNIRYFKANLTLVAIHEEIYVKPVENVTQEEKSAENVREAEEKPPEKEEKEKPRGDYFGAVLGFVIIVVLIILLKKVKRKSNLFF